MPTTYEYKIVTRTEEYPQGDTHEAEVYLNSLASEGWEVVSCEMANPSTGGAFGVYKTAVKYLLKRPKSQTLP